MCIRIYICIRIIVCIYEYFLYFKSEYNGIKKLIDWLSKKKPWQISGTSEVPWIIVLVIISSKNNVIFKKIVFDNNSVGMIIISTSEMWTSRFFTPTWLFLLDLYCSPHCRVIVCLDFSIYILPFFLALPNLQWLGSKKSPLLIKDKITFWRLSVEFIFSVSMTWVTYILFVNVQGHWLVQEWRHILKIMWDEQLIISKSFVFLRLL